MPSMFIRVEIDPQAATDRELAKKLVEVCALPPLVLSLSKDEETRD